jgi:hypothetical protein
LWKLLGRPDSHLHRRWRGLYAIATAVDRGDSGTMAGVDTKAFRIRVVIQAGTVDVPNPAAVRCDKTAKTSRIIDILRITEF